MARQWYRSALAASRPVDYTKLGLRVGMLVLLGLLIVSAGDPGNWRWMAGNAPAADEAPAKLLESKETVAAGPVDTDPKEREAADEEFAIVKDGGEKYEAREMAAWWRLFHWTLRQSIHTLARRSKAATLFELMNRPQEWRGKIVKLPILTAKRVIKHTDEKAPGGPRDYYEIHAFTEAPGSGLYVYQMLLPELPAGMPVGESLHEKVSAYGYFFKVKRYVDGRQLYSASPVFFGRVLWRPPVAVAKTPESAFLLWYLAVAIGVVAIIGLAVARFRRGAPASVVVFPGAGGANRPPEQWLDDPSMTLPLDEKRTRDPE